ARTGYTGEDGFELFTSPGDAEPVWMALAGAGEADGLVPAGLAARDTLRLEAGMPLYGNELSPEVTPFDAGLGRVVVFGKPGDFVGRAALAERAQAAPARVLAGLTIGSRRIPRHGYPVLWDGRPCHLLPSRRGGHRDQRRCGRRPRAAQLRPLRGRLADEGPARER